MLTENIPAGKGKISPIAYSGISAIAYSGPSAAYIYVFPAMSRPFPFDGRSRGSSLCFAVGPKERSPNGVDQEVSASSFELLQTFSIQTTLKSA